MRLMIAVLAAGAGRRMAGADKLTKNWRGKPLLTHVAGAARRGAPQVPILVLLNSNRFHPRAACVQGIGARKVLVRGAARGMSASLACAARIALREKADGLIIVPADLAGLRAASVAQIRRGFLRAPHDALRSWDADGAGHPTAIPRRYFQKLLTLKGESGARQFLTRARKIRSGGARMDFDRPQDFQP